MNLYQQLLEMKAKRAEKLAEGKELLSKKDFDAHKALMGEIEKMNAEIDAAEAQLAQDGRFGGNPHENEKVYNSAEGKREGAEERYAKAVKELASAARAGFPTVRKAPTAGEMMNEAVPADGGYTVPEDIVTRVVRLRESKESLLDLVSHTRVRTMSGRRTLQKRSQVTPFYTVEEAGKIGKLASPQFSTLEYKIEKRGGYLPVTNELLADSDENIAAIVENWLADHDRVTGNKLILDQIKTKDPVDMKNLDGVLGAWVGLGSVFRPTSSLITNDDGLLWLGTLKDNNGRYLLTPNPADSKQMRLAVGPHVLPIRTFDNRTIPTEKGKIPMILGDLKEGIMFWDRMLLSIMMSQTASAGDVNAFEQDLTLWRGLIRNDCTLWDDEAFTYGYVTAAGGAASTQSAGSAKV